MRSLDHVIHTVAETLEDEWGVHATIDIHPPTSKWGTLRLHVTPFRPGAAPITAWDDDGVITIAIGNSTSVEVEDPLDIELVQRSLEVINRIAREGLTERRIGRISLTPLYGADVVRRLPFEHRVQWQPYGDNSV